MTLSFLKKVLIEMKFNVLKINEIVVLCLQVMVHIDKTATEKEAH